MNIPGFTAEASFGKMMESYVLTSDAPAETGRVLPQFCRRSGDGFDCTYCWDEGGFSGCYTNHIHIPTLF